MTPNEAVSKVRKNLDEQGLNDSVMYTSESTDNESLDLIIKRTLPEAINAVCMTAAVTTLEGESVLKEITSAGIEDNVLYFKLPESSKFLRLVYFKATDSEHIVTEVVAEASAEGRKQLNKHIRGTYDKPRLVYLQGSAGSPEFNYYSLKEMIDDKMPEEYITQMQIIRRSEYSEDVTSYNVPTELRDVIIRYLTGMVLAIYGENDKANYFMGAGKEE